MATIPLGLYLWKRIHEVGVDTIMGVPGDFNLQLLDHIYNVPGLKWVGNANELNSAYAADGYARVKNGPGCLVTTHGVGEMSAINGIAGAMTEQIKVIHVVGQTLRSMQAKHMMIHHSIGFSPDHQVYNKASAAFRVAAAELQDKETAPAQIDRAIRECFIKSGPIYIFFPLDMVDEQVPASLLDTPIDVSLPDDEESRQSTKDAAAAIADALIHAKNPIIYVDCLVQHHNAVAELRQLVDKLQLPVYASNMGKGLINEDHPLYAGIYSGVTSTPGLADVFESSDLVLVLGILPSDTNTGGFTLKISPESSIDVKPDEVVVKDAKTFSRVYFKKLFPLLTESIDSAKLPKTQMPTIPAKTLAGDHASSKITQSWVWHRLTKFLQPHDVFIGETGTASFGIPDAKFPNDINWQTQTYYGSIGYATPSALGSELALRDLSASGVKPCGRTILVTGDGSLQLTIQEIGTMITYGTKPLIFVINNAGYTIERVIHGAHQKYNDISPYKFSHVLPLFGMNEEDAKTHFHRAETKEELEKVLAKEEVNNPTKVTLIELIMDKLDVPWRLIEQIATRGPESVKKMKDAGFNVRTPDAE